ncbi:MAG TPA: carbon starvation protein A [Deltaproteobacteria bacterium]|nr:MAG: carbon starvation protein CstA [Deltaproteobacteria bacterium GWA2_45_12]HBF13258.1 carbon starvation protein A [Deltaproteobacteria bacterium]
MPLPLLAILVLVVLFLGYHFYGKFIARVFIPTDKNQTPAHTFNDGVDFVPTKPFYLLSQHFSAIAAAGPIAGPILAAQNFGWLPCLLWIGFGVVFIGAVHDFGALMASVRHKGNSIAEIIRENIGSKAALAMMGFIWLALLYVIVAFTDITASTFLGKSEELQGLNVSFNRGGAVAMASALYLALSIVLGIIQKKFNPPLWLVTLVFVPATLGAVWLGTHWDGFFVMGQKSWGLTILAYCFVASLLPVWMLLQPRGYLGGFVLYMALAVGTLGLFFGGYEITQPAFKTWQAPGLTGSLFPFLFVTIACGACSGFHGLVCTGTTSKQIDKETHCHPVGYGAMLMEGFVAVMALTTFMILPASQAVGPPAQVYGAGLGQFLTLIIGKENLVFAMTFGAMAFSTFVFDTLDVATRLGRYIIQELTGLKNFWGAALGTGLTVAIPAFFLLSAKEGSWTLFWVLFGTSNQMLAALTLLGISIWLKKSGKKYWFTFYPMIFVMGMTVWSLFKQITMGLTQWQTTGFGTPAINAAIGIMLLLLAGFMVMEAGRVWKKNKYKLGGGPYYSSRDILHDRCGKNRL